MKLRKLGSSGIEVSAVGLGCNNFGGRIGLEATRDVVDRAIDSGITLFDTADAYGNRGGSETLLGEVLGARRKQIVLATKFGLAMDDSGTAKGASRRYVMEAVEASLKRLKTDWIDLYQLHFPDPATPIEETLRALDDLVQQGKVRQIGWSNMTAWQLADAVWTSRSNGLKQFVTVQAEYSLLETAVEQEIIPAAEHYGVGLLPFYPLAGGMLTGKYHKDAMPASGRLTNTPKLANRLMTPANWRRVDICSAFAAERGHTLLELAFSWLLANPVVSSVIAGATSAAQVEANVAAGAWELTPDELKDLNQRLAA
jgi:aryl-alcohol dehydrogenase-like predicted oxidoreductase